jgi:hypothetical protein
MLFKSRNALVKANYFVRWDYFGRVVLFVKYNYNYHVDEDEVDGACGTNGGEEDHVQPEGKRPLGGPRYRWIDNFKMDLSSGTQLHRVS